MVWLNHCKVKNVFYMLRFVSQLVGIKYVNVNK